MRSLCGLLLCCMLVPATAHSQRAGTYEIYLGPLLTGAKSRSLEGGGTARTDAGVGLNLGFARNFSPHFSAGVDIAWSEADYSVQPGAAGAAPRIDGTVETGTLRFNGVYNFFARDLTPFVTGGLGWTHVDINIPAGMPAAGCVYGGSCAGSVPAQTTTRFSYDVGAGLRLDVGEGLLRMLLAAQYVDSGGSYGSTTQVRIDFGMRF